MVSDVMEPNCYKKHGKINKFYSLQVFNSIGLKTWQTPKKREKNTLNVPGKALFSQLSSQIVQTFRLVESKLILIKIHKSSKPKLSPLDLSFMPKFNDFTRLECYLGQLCEVSPYTTKYRLFHLAKIQPIKVNNQNFHKI